MQVGGNGPNVEERVLAFGDGGVGRCLLLLPAGTESELLTTLDDWASLVSGR